MFPSRPLQTQQNYPPRQYFAQQDHNLQLQYTKKTQEDQPESLRIEILLPNLLQQHENSRHQLTNLTQLPNTVETLQMTLNSYLMGGSSITSNKNH